jgi:hypothetical protein
LSKIGEVEDLEFLTPSGANFESDGASICTGAELQRLHLLLLSL